MGRRSALHYIPTPLNLSCRFRETNGSNPFLPCQEEPLFQPQLAAKRRVPPSDATFTPGFDIDDIAGKIRARVIWDDIKAKKHYLRDHVRFL